MSLCHRIPAHPSNSALLPGADHDLQCVGLRRLLGLHDIFMLLQSRPQMEMRLWLMLSRQRNRQAIMCPAAATATSARMCPNSQGQSSGAQSCAEPEYDNSPAPSSS